VFRLSLGRVRGLVLCGGEGVHLRPLTYYFQKGMIHVGSTERYERLNDDTINEHLGYLL